MSSASKNEGARAAARALQRVRGPTPSAYVRLVAELGDNLARMLSSRSPALRGGRLVFAVDAHVDEDQKAGDCADDERHGAAEADGAAADPDEEPEEERPEERDDPVVDGGEAKVHRAPILPNVPHRLGPKKFSEPVALSSTFPVNLRLPPTALGSGFDLLALRARCKREGRGRAPRLARGGETPRPQFADTSAKAVQNSAGCRALQRRSDQKFTEPVALSSTFPVNLRLPPTALGSGFDLLALRARCQKNVPSGTGPNQEGEAGKTPLFASGAWGNPVDDGQARSSESNRRNNPGRSSNAPGSWIASINAAIRGVITIR